MDFMAIILVALLFFGVGAAISVGPLLFSRLFTTCKTDKCKTDSRPQRSLFSVVPLLAGLGLLAMTFGALSTIFSPRETAHTTPVHWHSHNNQLSFSNPTSNEHSPVNETPTLSIFDDHVPKVFASQPVQRQSLLAVLVPLLAVATLLGFAVGKMRTTVLQAIPILVCIGVPTLFWVNHRMSVRQHKQTEVAFAQDQLHDRTTQSQSARDETIARKPPEIELASLVKPGHENIPAQDESDVVLEKETADTSADSSPPIVEFVKTSVVGVPRTELPDWATESDSEGPVQLVMSGKFATVAAAEEEALKKLSRLLRSQFVGRHPEATGWSPSATVVMSSGSILHRVIQEDSVQIGEHVEPMYEAYWQVDTSVQDGLYQAWRPIVVHQRLGWLGGGIGLLTLLFGSLATFLRVDEKTGGRRRKTLAAGTLTMWLAIGGALLVLA